MACNTTKLDATAELGLRDDMKDVDNWNRSGTYAIPYGMLIDLLHDLEFWRDKQLAAAQAERSE